MKNKKGFTLTEMLIVLVLLLALTGTTLLGMEEIQKQGAKKRLRELSKEIEIAADVYVNTHPEISVNLLNNGVSGECVRIYSLQGAGLLDNRLVNPVTGEKIPANLCVDISVVDGVLVSSFDLE